MADAGYDITRLAFVLADLPVELLGPDALRPGAAPAQAATACPGPPAARPSTARSSPWIGPPPGPQPQHTTSTDTTRYGTATATSWDRVHPRLTHRGCWLDHDGELPVIEGTLIRLQVDHLPGDRDPKPVWLWSSTTGATAADVDRWWQAFLRRFDLEHTFRLFKQTLGWTAPEDPHPAAGGPLDLADHRRRTPNSASPGRSPPTCAATWEQPRPARTAPPPGQA